MIKYITEFKNKDKKFNSFIIFEKTKFFGYKIAKLIAMNLLCIEKDKRICRHCVSCKMFYKNIHPDYYEINYTKTQEITIEKIRIIINKINKSSFLSNKVVLIYPADQMNVNVSNCLLKTLEEPPKNTMFLLVTTCNNLLKTLIDRCQILNFENNFNIKESKITTIFMYKYFLLNENKCILIDEYLKLIKTENIIDILETLWLFFNNLIYYKISNEKLKNLKLFKLIEIINYNQIEKLQTIIDKIIFIKYLISKNFKINVEYFIKNLLL
ncbi:MAG TPA: hypothetical protein V7791_01075 [Candidatus Azoamicus sp. OHIO1]